MPSAEIMPGRCGAKVADGYCTQWPIRGTKRCRSHPGMSLSKARAKGQIVLDLQGWGLDADVVPVDPGEVYLRLITQAAVRVQRYSTLLAEAYDAAEQLRGAHEAEEIVLADPEPRV